MVYECCGGFIGVGAISLQIYFGPKSNVTREVMAAAVAAAWVTRED